MATVYVGLGSNIDPELNLHLGIRELRERYGELELSAVYRSEAVGFEGENFLNLVARFESEEYPVQSARKSSLYIISPDGIVTAESGSHVRSISICCFTIIW